MQTLINIELHNALKNIIQSEGQDILKETRRVNILNDFNAYQKISTSKYILRAIIAEDIQKTISIRLMEQQSRNSQKFSAMADFI